MYSFWTLTTNAKSIKNAETLLNKLQKQLLYPAERIVIEGDRYSGHRVCFRLESHCVDRPTFLYELLSQAEVLGNSWTLGAVTERAYGWCNRSRIAGIQQIEWRELD